MQRTAFTRLGQDLQSLELRRGGCGETVCRGVVSSVEDDVGSSVKLRASSASSCKGGRGITTARSVLQQQMQAQLQTNSSYSLRATSLPSTTRHDNRGFRKTDIGEGGVSNTQKIAACQVC